MQQKGALSPVGEGPGAFGVWSTPPDGLTAKRAHAAGIEPGRGQKLLQIGNYTFSAESRENGKRLADVFEFISRVK